MLEDKLLIWKLKRGSSQALRRIYEKYRDDLLRLASALLNENNLAEDIVHDVFISFIRSVDRFQLTGTLKGYLARCVANRARNVNRARGLRHAKGLDEAEQMASGLSRPEHWIIRSEEFDRLSNAMAKLPYEQREVVILHVQGEMKFRQIAELQDVSIKTVQSRFRYGLDKLRSLLNSEVEK